MDAKEAWEGWLPQKPQDQIDLALKVLETARTNLYTQYEYDTRSLTAMIQERDSELKTLVNENTGLQLEMEEAQELFGRLKAEN